jgi:hypothetical protein
MDDSQGMPTASAFLIKQIPIFLHRFAMEYYREMFCIEFFVNDRLSGNTISSSIVLSYNASRGDLHVSRFHPELYLEPNSKYMSAVCFYLIIQHSSDLFSLPDGCHISLETLPFICDGFYRKLKDFNFHIHRHGLGNVVELVSHISACSINTGMILEHRYRPCEMPFMQNS